MHGTFVAGISRQDIEEANAEVRRGFRYTLPEPVLQEHGGEVRKLVADGTPRAQAIRTVVRKIIPRRQKPGENRKQAYKTALRVLLKGFSPLPEPRREELDTIDAAEDCFRMAVSRGDIILYPDERYTTLEP